MRALLCERWCAYDELAVRDVAPPVLRPGTVRLRVLAAGVSFATQLVVSGRYQRKPPLPFAPGTDVVGTVIEIAPDVRDVTLGTMVFAVLDWGGSAEEVVVDAIHVMPIPPGLDPVDAVCLPNSYATSAAALTWRVKLNPDSWVLVHGAGGGVGLAAVEIAHALGARVIARAGTAKHAELLKRGATVVLDSSRPFRDEVWRITGRGVDVVYDTLGGDVFDESLRCLGDGGTLLTIGYAAGGIPQLSINLLLLKNIGVVGLNWGTYVGWSPGDNRHRYAPRVRALWQQLLDWWQAGLIAPHVDARFPLEQFREAMATVRARSAIGRVVLMP